MSDPTGNFSLRVRLAKSSPDAGEAIAKAEAMAVPNETMRQALALGMQKLAFKAQKERFTGQGPFPIAQKRLGNVTGRLKRDLHAEDVTITARGYRSRIGSVVEYFGAHEVGFEGDVSVRAHVRAAHTIKKRNMSRLEQSVRAHTRHVKILARMPLRTAIEEHSEAIFSEAIKKGVAAL